MWNDLRSKGLISAVLMIVLLLPLLVGCIGGSVQPTSSPSPTVQSTSSPSPTAKPTQTHLTAKEIYPPLAWMDSTARAVHVMLWGSPYLERDLKLAKDGGFTWIKQMFQWNYIEGKGKGQFEWNEPDRIVSAAKRYGLRIIARVDISPKWAIDPASASALSSPPKNLQDYADFVYALASRYKNGSPYGQIDAYEIWNEPNLAREWGGRPPNVKEYVTLLKLAYQSIKKADPQAIVISAGLAPTTASGAIAMPDMEFVKQMYEEGAKDYFDMLGAHAAGYKAPPELSPDEVAYDPRYDHNEPGAGRIYCFRHVEDLRKIMVKYGDEQKRIAILEFGWTSDPRPDSPYKWQSVSEAEKADYLVRAFQYAKEHWRPWIGAMTVIYIASPDWTPAQEQYYWSITNPDGTVRPAYTALKNMRN
ncbi:MAG: hypothetical protein M1136_06790 [Chloroflexi bacterium]|nr:hypothetical protein [Chloroflexota bacterium]MCL5075339.1 hypothetical protein [Chloroflexota bacterium]